MDASNLLPGNSGIWESAIAAGIGDELPVPIRQIMDPQVTPAAFLPFLAAHRSVKLWFTDWAEQRKRDMVEQAPQLAELIGTHQGAVRFLGFVDAEVLDTISYPARFVFGQSAIGVTPIDHPPFKARYLVRVTLDRRANSLIFGRSALGQASLRPVDLEPIRRAKLALQVARAPEAEYVVTFAWRRPITVGDSIAADGSYKVGGFDNRERL
jgi:P2-related tail formation protein